MANIQNVYYAEKVTKIREKLPKIGDPIENLRKLMNKRPHLRQEGLTLKTVRQKQINKIIIEL